MRVDGRACRMQCEPGRVLSDLGLGGWFSLCRYLPVELRWPGDHERGGRPGSGDREAVPAIAGHEDKAPGSPAVVLAKTGELPRELVEHLVLAGARAPPAPADRPTP